MIDKIPWKDWQVIEKIGEGSYGSVYKAKRDLGGTDLFSAIKVVKIPNNRSEINSMRAEGRSNEEIIQYYQEMVANCLNEIKVSVALKGAPNVVTVEDYQMSEDRENLEWTIYIRMELLTSLIDYMSVNPMNEFEVVKLGIDICSALEYCAKENIIHRDIKPENIFVSKHGNYILGDFGIARQLDNKASNLSAKGTFNYMAPEVYHGEHYDDSIDTYSLAIVMYKLVNNNTLPFVDEMTGMPAYQANEEAINRRMRGVSIPPPKKASPTLTDILETALEYRPQGRFRVAKAMRNALMSIEEKDYLDPNETVAIRRAPREALPHVGNQNVHGQNIHGANYNSSNQSWNHMNQSQPVSFDQPRKSDKGMKIAIVIVGMAILMSAVALFLIIRSDNKTEEAVTEENDNVEQDESTDSLEAEVTPTEVVEELAALRVGESEVELGGLQRAQAATYGQSSMIHQSGLNNTAMATFDGDETTSWQEYKNGSAHDDGIGEAIWFNLDRVYEVEYLVFKLGNWNTKDGKDYYHGNNRPKVLKIKLNDKVFEVEFPDKKETQYLKLSYPYPVDKVEISIVEVYQGSNWRDTCIAEVGVYGK